MEAKKESNLGKGEAAAETIESGLIDFLPVPACGLPLLDF